MQYFFYIFSLCIEQINCKTLKSIKQVLHKATPVLGLLICYPTKVQRRQHKRTVPLCSPLFLLIFYDILEE